MLISFFLLSVICWGRPRSVNLEKELDDARLASRAKIISYEKGILTYKVVRKPKKKPLTARYASSRNRDAMEFLDAKELASTTSNAPMTSAWPAVGTEVLVVIDDKFRVTLFAAQKGKDYRFWSPWETEEIPIFRCDPPARGLPTEKHDDVRHFSNEGCLYPVKLFKEKP